MTAILVYCWFSLGFKDGGLEFGELGSIPHSRTCSSWVTLSHSQLSQGSLLSPTYLTGYLLWEEEEKEIVGHSETLRERQVKHSNLLSYNCEGKDEGSFIFSTSSLASLQFF